MGSTGLRSLTGCVLCLVCSCGGVDLQYSCRLMTHISLTHLTLTMPQCGPHLLPGRMKTSISLTNLIRLKMKRKRKSSSTRRSLEVEGFNSHTAEVRRFLSITLVLSITNTRSIISITDTTDNMDLLLICTLTNTSSITDNLDLLLSRTSSSGPGHLQSNHSREPSPGEEEELRD